MVKEWISETNINWDHLILKVNTLKNHLFKKKYKIVNQNKILTTKSSYDRIK
jgi:hypothetical protein